MSAPIRSSHELVVEIQALRAAGAHRDAGVLVAQLLNLCLPLLRRVAQRFSPSARGIVGLDDLEQVGAIEALKLVDKYRPALAMGPFAFEALLRQRAMRACAEQLRLHAQSIRPSDGDQRAGVPRPVVVELDEAQHELGEESPEQHVVDAQVRRRVRQVVGQMPVELSRVLASAYGIGCTRKSLRAMACDWHEDRAQLTRALRHAKRRAALELADVA